MRLLLALLVLATPVIPARAEFPSNQLTCDSFRRVYSGCSADANAGQIQAGCEMREREVASPHETEAMRKSRFERCLAQQATRVTTGCSFCQTNFPSRPADQSSAPPKAPGGPGENEREKPAPGSTRPRDPSTCEGSESCLRDAERQNRDAAARARLSREDLQRGSRETTQNRNSTIAAAADLLDAWQRNLEARPNAQEQARFQHDRKLYLRALDDLGFTRRDASAAYDRVVREELVNIVEMRELDKSYRQESERSSVREAEFQGLAEKSGSRAQALGFGSKRIESNRALLLAPSMDGTLPKSDAVNRSTIAEAQRSETPAASASQKISSSESGKTGSRGSPGGKFTDKTSFRAPSSSSGGLRDLLRRRLKGEAGATGASGLKSANAGASGRGARGEASEQSAADLAAELIASAETELKPGAAFSGIEISAEETERQRRSLMSEAGMDETQGSTGLLGAESGTLFDRVRHAHRGCLARGCL